MIMRLVGVLKLPEGTSLDDLKDYEVMTAFHYLKDRGFAEVNAAGEIVVTRLGREVNHADRLLKVLCTARTSQS